MDSMLKKLRVKFVAIIMAVSAAVLAVSFTTICIVNYNQSVDHVYTALENALDRDAGITGSSALDLLFDDLDPFSDTLPGDSSDSADSAAPGNHPEGQQLRQGWGQMRRLEIGNNRREESLIPVAVYRIGYDGNLYSISDVGTGTLGEDTLAEAASAVDDLPDGRGKLESLGVFYMKSSLLTGTYVAFADESSAAEWQSLALTLTGVGACALIVLFLVAMLFSKWALKPVAESWQRQQQFVADASHELKTPLTVMMADTSILMRDPEKTIASQSRWLESMKNEISNMQELVGDMLLLASADARGALAGEDAQTVDFSKLAESHLLQFDSLAFEYGTEVDSQIEESINVKGNAERLKRLVNTLLDNAFKYAGKGGVISVTLKRSAGNAVFSVHNSGTAIPAEDLPHIFDRFYRVDKARGRDEQRSYGLGLAIAREIAQEHGGTLSAESSAEAGTTFTFTLPVASTGRH